MSVEHLKKQAKNTQRLLEAFTGAPQGSVKLSAAQEFVAQSHGYPDWHSALNAEVPQRLLQPRVGKTCGC